jgi:hypothetical protein
MEYFVQESQWIVRERLAIDELTLKIELDQAALNQAYLQVQHNYDSKLKIILNFIFFKNFY